MSARGVSVTSVAFQAKHGRPPLAYPSGGSLDPEIEQHERRHPDGAAPTS
jgi:hypothetical protein